jgi:hypothetical protein
MKCFLIALVLSAVVGCAQDSGNGNPTTPKTGAAEPRTGSVLLCKLESVTWNPESQELSWIVSTRNISGGDPTEGREKYTIHLDTAVMNSRGEGRRFDADEAHQVGQLMEIINAYTVESTLWWAKGMGEKVNEKDAAPPQNKAPEPHKGDQPKEQPKASPVLRAPLNDPAVRPNQLRDQAGMPPRN